MAKTKAMNKGAKVTATLKDGTVVPGKVVLDEGKGWITVKHEGGEDKLRASKVTLITVEGSGLVQADLSKYTIHESKTENGRKHVDIADDTADKLREMSLNDIYRYAASTLECTIKELHDKYDHLNPGMQRMNLGNRIRVVFRVAAEVKDGLKKKRSVFLAKAA